MVFSKKIFAAALICIAFSGICSALTHDEYLAETKKLNGGDNFSLSFFEVTPPGVKLIDTVLRNVQTPLITYPDGRTIRYVNLLRRGRVAEEWRTFDAISYKDTFFTPSLAYVVIDYPDEGTFYGFIEGIERYEDDDYTLLYGSMVRTVGDTVAVVMHTPKYWEKSQVSRPSGKYSAIITSTHKEVDYDINEQKVKILNGLKYYFTFQPGGFMVFEVGNDYTTVADTERAGSYRIKGANGKMKKRGNRIGGWHFDCHPRNTYNAKWDLKDNVMNIKITSGPKFSITTKQNIDRTIYELKKSLESHYKEYNYDANHYQWVQQSKGEWSIAPQVPREKRYQKDIFAKLAVEDPIPPEQSFYLLGIDKNDMVLLKSNGRPFIFQKNKTDVADLLDDVYLNTINELFDEKREIGIEKLAIMRANNALAEVPKLNFGGEYPLKDWAILRTGSNPDKFAAYLVFDRSGNLNEFRVATVKFDNDKLDTATLVETQTVIPHLEQAIAEMESLDAQLQQAAKKSSDKEAKQRAKDYVKFATNKPVKTNFDSVRDFDRAYADVNERIKIQKKALNIAE